MSAPAHDSSDRPLNRSPQSPQSPLTRSGPPATVPRATPGPGRLGLSLAALATAALLAACGGGGGDDGSPTPGAGTGGTGGGTGDGGGTTTPPPLQAEVRRTSMGIPHVKATDFQTLGFGVGFAQARDNLCTIADAMLTYRGERSAFFGPTAPAVNDSTVGMPPNLASDFYHRHVLDDALVARLAAAQPAEVVAMATGYVAGYNRYVAALRSGALPTETSGANAACASQPWVRSLVLEDVYRRMHAATLAGGYANFALPIALAEPPAASGGTGPVTRAPAAVPTEGLTITPPTLRVGGRSGIGSNMIGLGTAATGTDTPMLFGNPHWYWKGPDRFYQMQQTVDGSINASGVGFLGMPFILIGFNNAIAWSHTVSTARRFGFFEYDLDPADPTRVMIDGTATPLTPHDITVQVLGTDGQTTPVTRRLYRSSEGPMVNLAALNPALAWSTAKAFAIRDVNDANYRTYATWLAWGRAASMDEFQAIQRQQISIPWVNTVAVGRGAAQTWYADIGNVPNVPDAISSTCTTAIGTAVQAAMPATPFLNGSRATCTWQTAADGVQPGSLGLAELPFLLRDDYVLNSNDSYWLSNPSAPLSGFPAIMGSTSSAQSLRTRMAQTMVWERLSGSDGNTVRHFDATYLKEMVLNSRIYSAEMLMPQVLSEVCAGASGNLQAACTVLGSWNQRGDSGSQGSILWDAFFTNLLAAVPSADLYEVPFDATDPLNTPRGLAAGAVEDARTALTTAAATLQGAGLALDVSKGSVMFAERQGTRIPLYGGCHDEGYFTILCSDRSLAQGNLSVDGQAHGNTYLQVVSFPGTTVEAWSFLTFSQSDDPASAHYADYTRAYSQQQWLRVPFTEAEITADSGYQTLTVSQ